MVSLSETDGKKNKKHLTRTPRYIIMEQDTNVSSKGEKDMVQEEKLKALDAALAQIEKQFEKVL